MDSNNHFMQGVKHGIPIFMGYLPVSFTFGFMAVSGGLPVWTVILISLTNLTSAGQFAGASLIMASAAYFEMGLTVFVINLRYMLMSLSLSQKIESRIPIWKRMIFAFGITDETFVVASMQPGQLTSSYMMGLISMPIVGWNLGTILGCCMSEVIPVSLQNAMGIALYAMFIALIIPPARKSRAVLVVVAVAVVVTSALKYIPLFQMISSGFRIIIATVVAAGLGAAFFPKEEESEEHVA
ncbi:AzlC family ABC transporter permease [Hespellia stercorisuis]|uniref:Predicted branched-chain amino acid permease (Azaleucine resistance) n=1 Tax=Hespellia stercorisuis DSM 15480 TaxID=1121950 RepID=A0A1M6MDS6_9FIRM|nr:AzlC family ABC transporter permease [Hespellia stercorisuis]SHJ81614.1 Predicted branched-chain amino acid permease (azaleucine resistance) [Hespellia stercorisuis DSM 15480]